MSFPENDRKFRSNSGKSFPDGDGYDAQRIAYVPKISVARLVNTSEALSRALSWASLVDGIRDSDRWIGTLRPTLCDLCLRFMLFVD